MIGGIDMAFKKDVLNNKSYYDEWQNPTTHQLFGFYRCLWQ